jgi:hypothetical protein
MRWYNLLAFAIHGFRKRGDKYILVDKFSVADTIGSDRTFMQEGVIGASILGVFLDGGRQSATTAFHSEVVLDTLNTGAGNSNEGVGVSVMVRGLNNAWAAMASENGSVYGNGTGEDNTTQNLRRQVGTWM